jgi:sigma-E factor negative regulatory protein RseC
MGANGEMEVKVINEAGAKAGDRILLSFKTSSLLKATFLLYVFPILLLFVGALFGQTVAPKFDFNPSGLAAITGFTFFFVALLIVRTSANKLARKTE